MPSLTAECLAPVLNAGRRGDREAFDASAAMSRRKGDIDVSQLGKNAKMPWEVDGPKWHTQDRVAHNGQRPRWSGEILRKVIDTLEENDGFAPPNWNARSVVEVVGTKNKSVGWFLHAMTGDEWALTLRFHVPKGRFETESLAERLQLKEWDALEDIPVNGRQPRVRVNKAAGPWQEVAIVVIDEEEIATPAFEQFLKEAVESYFEAANPEKLNLDDLTPWKKLGRKWHVMRKGFLKGRVVWDVETLDALFTLLDDVWPTATVDWSGKVLVNYKQGKRKLATVVTKRPANIELALPIATGTISLGRIADLCEEPEIRTGSDGQEYASLKFTNLKQIQNPLLKDFVQSLNK